MMQKVKNLKHNTFSYSRPNIRAGLECFSETTIPVYLILEYLSEGYSVEDISKKFPTIKQKYITDFLSSLSVN